MKYVWGKFTFGELVPLLRILTHVPTMYSYTRIVTSGLHSHFALSQLYTIGCGSTQMTAVISPLIFVVCTQRKLLPGAVTKKGQEFLCLFR